MTDTSPRTPIRRTRTEKLLVVFACALVGLTVAIAVALYWAHRADQRSQDYKESKTAAVQALSTANNNLTKAGLAPVPTPTVAGPAPTVTVTQTVPGATGPAGRGPAQAEIANAVASYCQAAKCGVGPTIGQVAQAVATYCGRNGKCRGPAGRDGVSGAPGAPGASGPPGNSGAVGRPGQDATADQVAAAVATYCAAHNGCSGPAGSDGSAGPVGPSGPTGPTGAIGPGGADGQPPVSWTYTDGLGQEHTCHRADPFDATAPTYTCN